MNKRCSCILLLVVGFVLTDALFSNENVDSVFLRLVNRGGTYMDVSLSNIQQIVPHLNPNKLTILYIHGHRERVDAEGVTPIINTLLQYTTENILALDYRKVAGLVYPLSVEQIPAIGVVVAKSLEKLVEAGVKAESIYIIGHSLGAQLGGYIGRNLNFKLTRITGLDPAGPLYYVENPHLSASDAKFVDIIHTDGGVFGLLIPTGTVDFYPNSGRPPQPGCHIGLSVSDDNVTCNHHRSWMYFIESLKNKNAFIAVKCPNTLKFISGSCNRNEKAIMGYYASPESKGTYYLRTAAAEPYGLGSVGALS